jgi:hypothetical protein
MGELDFVDKKYANLQGSGIHRHRSHRLDDSYEISHEDFYIFLFDLFQRWWSCWLYLWWWIFFLCLTFDDWLGMAGGAADWLGRWVVSATNSSPPILFFERTQLYPAVSRIFDTQLLFQEYGGEIGEDYFFKIISSTELPIR